MSLIRIVQQKINKIKLIKGQSQQRKNNLHWSQKSIKNQFEQNHKQRKFVKSNQILSRKPSQFNLFIHSFVYHPTQSKTLKQNLNKMTLKPSSTLYQIYRPSSYFHNTNFSANSHVNQRSIAKNRHHFYHNDNIPATILTNPQQKSYQKSKKLNNTHKTAIMQTSKPQNLGKNKKNKTKQEKYINMIMNKNNQQQINDNQEIGENKLRNQRKMRRQNEIKNGNVILMMDQENDKRIIYHTIYTNQKNSTRNLSSHRLQNQKDLTFLSRTFHSINKQKSLTKNFLYKKLQKKVYQQQQQYIKNLHNQKQQQWLQNQKNQNHTRKYMNHLLKYQSKKQWLGQNSSRAEEIRQRSKSLSSTKSLKSVISKQQLRNKVYLMRTTTKQNINRAKNQSRIKTKTKSNSLQSHLTTIYYNKQASQLQKIQQLTHKQSIIQKVLQKTQNYKQSYKQLLLKANKYNSKQLFELFMENTLQQRKNQQRRQYQQKRRRNGSFVSSRENGSSIK